MMKSGRDDAINSVDAARRRAIFIALTTFYRFSDDVEGHSAFQDFRAIADLFFYPAVTANTILWSAAILTIISHSQMVTDAYAGVDDDAQTALISTTAVMKSARFPDYGHSRTLRFSGYLSKSRAIATRWPASQRQRPASIIGRRRILIIATYAHLATE